MKLHYLLSFVVAGTWLRLFHNEHNNNNNFLIMINACDAFSTTATFVTKPARYYTSKKTILLSTKNKMGNDNDNFVKMQKETSDKNTSPQRNDNDNILITNNDNDNNNNEQEFLKHQQIVFNEMSELFADHSELIPETLIPTYQRLANDIITNLILHDHNDNATMTTNTTISILDVACGTGVLWKFLNEAAKSNNVNLEITGVDLSPKMIERATKHAKQIITTTTDDDKSNNNDNSKTSSTTTSIECVSMDILEYCKQNNNNNNNGDETDNNHNNNNKKTYYNGIILNACFGNFYNPNLVLSELCSFKSCNNDKKKIFITHPLGASFVQDLHDKSPQTVPHTLPTNFDSIMMTMPLQLSLFVNENEYYFVCLQKIRAQPMNKILKFRGPVAFGYGRGGKKLGFPTANLPASLFQNALSTVDTGVYIGWAVIENNNNKTDYYNDSSENQQESESTLLSTKKITNNIIHKAVVNVGFSPTFEGQENVEKIIEAHLIVSDPIDDFYGKTMRLQLSGFLRPEMKFDSFPQLIQQITADVQDADKILSTTIIPYQKLQQDDFLLSPSSSLTWVGASGGNETASWEFIPFSDALK